MTKCPRRVLFKERLDRRDRRSRRRDAARVGTDCRLRRGRDRPKLGALRRCDSRQRGLHALAPSCETFPAQVRRAPGGTAILSIQLRPVRRTTGVRGSLERAHSIDRQGAAPWLARTRHLRRPPAHQATRPYQLDGPELPARVSRPPRLGSDPQLGRPRRLRTARRHLRSCVEVRVPAPL